MKLIDLTVACPSCGSQNVVYSCEPTCCFNHVCGDCLTNFQLLTRDLGGELIVPDIERGQRDGTAPTAACVRCQSLDVYAVESGDVSSQPLVCLSCQARLELVFETSE